MDLSKRIQRLEKRVELLEKKGPQGTRLKQIAAWILEQFEEVDKIPVHVIMKRARRQGFSDQMVQRAKRTHLDGMIEATIKKKDGWNWEDFR